MYSEIIFDLDDTLVNNIGNIKQAFKIILEYVGEGYTDSKFEKFYQIDKKIWSDRAAGKLLTPYEDNKEKAKEYLRAIRFIKYFDNKIEYSEAVKINEIYIDGLKEIVIPIEGAYNIIKYLYEKKYNITIATNGPLIPLKDKLQKIGIYQYVKSIFSAEEVGYMKPNKQFFEGLLEKINKPPKENILFIGDNLQTDIKGGIENNIDTCWCNYDKIEIEKDYIPKYEIHKLEELKLIL